MATLRRVSTARGTVYRAVIRRKGVVLSRTFRTRSDAGAWALRKEADIDRDVAGLVHEAFRKKLSEAIAKYRAEVLPGKEATTQRDYTRHLDYWDRELGARKLSEITAQTIAAKRDQLADGADLLNGERQARSAATVNRYLATLAAVFSAAVKKWHWLPVSPLKAVAKLEESKGRTRFLTNEELARLLDACKSSESADLYLAVLMSITTGARQSEIMGLRWENIDLNKSVIHLHKTKNKDSRTLPIVEQVAPMLKARREAAGAIQLRGLVFPSLVSDRNPILLRRSWVTALREAKVRNFRWHDLRHSAASFLAMNGATLPEIGAVLGHRSAQTTKRYAHLTQEHTHALVGRTMSRILGGDGTNKL